MGVWADRVVPHIVEKSGSNPHVEALRDQVCEGLHGRVLEIGFGSGLNIAHYPAAVASVHAVEPSDVGWRLSEERRTSTAVPIERSGLDGQRLDEPDESFDCVLSTLTLCTIPDATARWQRYAACCGRAGGCTSSSTDSRPTPRWRPGSGG